MRRTTGQVVHRLRRSTVILAGTLLGAFLALVPGRAPAAPGGGSMQVDCNRGKTIGWAVAHASSPREIVISGHCHENVRIERDDVTLISTTGAKITGVDATVAAILVDGAQRVTVEGLSVEGGNNSAIEVARGGAVLLRDVSALFNARAGLLIIDHASATVIDSTFSDNRDGIGVWAGSAVNLQGAVVCDRNTRAGVLVSGSALSTAVQAAPKLLLRDNGFLGLYLQLAANGLVSMPVEASGSDEGIGVYDGSVLALGVFEVRDNSFSGVTLWNNSTMESRSASLPVILEDNLHGIWIEDDSSFFRQGPTHFAGNTDAAAYLDGSNVFLRSVTSDGTNGGGFYARNSSVELSNSNLEDRLELSFGTRVEGGGNAAIAEVVCDSTVISQLDHPCGHVESTLAAVAGRREAKSSVARRPRPGGRLHAFEP